jgi:hypothetical protein
MLGLGLATPLAAASLTSVMLTALRTAVWRDGFKTGEGGYEVLLLVSALALAESGPGRLSLDAQLQSERRGVGWAAAALGATATGRPSRSRSGSDSQRRPRTARRRKSLASQSPRRPTAERS